MSDAQESRTWTIMDVVDEVDEEDEQPTVERQAWIQADDYWRKATYIAATGRHAVPQPPTRSLPRPKRFQKASPLRSLVVLALAVCIAVAVLAGMLIAQREATKRFILPTSLPTIPGLTQPSQAPAVTPSPSRTTTPASK